MRCLMGVAACAAMVFACEARAQIFLIAELQPPQPESDSGFGASLLDMQGPMVVGAPAMSLGDVAGVGAAYAFDMRTPQSPPVEFRPQQTLANAAYGSSLTGYSSVVAVAAPGGSAQADAPAPQGVVETWQIVDAWTRYGTISPPAGYEGTGFAQSISYSNQMLVVGFPGRIDNGTSAGSVLRFNEEAGDWDYLGAISLPISRFGETVYSEGANVLAADPMTTSVYYALGLAGLGTLPQPPQGEGVMVTYGQSIWANGDILIGTPYPLDYNADPLPGRVYHYRHSVDGDGYTLVETIMAPDAAPGDGFGASIDSFAFEFAIGAPRAAVAEVPGAGTVWLFDGTGLNITPRQRLTSTRPQPDGHFGTALTWKYGNLGIGAPGEAAASVPRAGVAYVFANYADIVFKGSFDYL